MFGVRYWTQSIEEEDEEDETKRRNLTPVFVGQLEYVVFVGTYINKVPAQNGH